MKQKIFPIICIVFGYNNIFPIIPEIHEGFPSGIFFISIGLVLLAGQISVSFISKTPVEKKRTIALYMTLVVVFIAIPSYKHFDTSKALDNVYQNDVFIYDEKKTDFSLFPPWGTSGRWATRGKPYKFFYKSMFGLMKVDRIDNENIHILISHGLTTNLSDVFWWIKGKAYHDPTFFSEQNRLIIPSNRIKDIGVISVLRNDKISGYTSVIHDLPRFDTINKVCAALGVRLVALPTESQ